MEKDAMRLLILLAVGGGLAQRGDRDYSPEVPPTFSRSTPYREDEGAANPIRSNGRRPYRDSREEPPAPRREFEDVDRRPERFDRPDHFSEPRFPKFLEPFFRRPDFGRYFPQNGNFSREPRPRDRPDNERRGGDSSRQDGSERKGSLGRSDSPPSKIVGVDMRMIAGVYPEEDRGPARDRPRNRFDPRDDSRGYTADEGYSPYREPRFPPRDERFPPRDEMLYPPRFKKREGSGERNSNSQEPEARPRGRHDDREPHRNTPHRDRESSRSDSHDRSSDSDDRDSRRPLQRRPQFYDRSEEPSGRQSEQEERQRPRKPQSHEADDEDSREKIAPDHVKKVEKEKDIDQSNEEKSDGGSFRPHNGSKSMDARDEKSTTVTESSQPENFTTATVTSTSEGIPTPEPLATPSSTPVVAALPEEPLIETTTKA